MLTMNDFNRLKKAFGSKGRNTAISFVKDKDGKTKASVYMLVNKPWGWLVVDVNEQGKVTLNKQQSARYIQYIPNVQETNVSLLIKKIRDLKKPAEKASVSEEASDDLTLKEMIQYARNS